MKGGVFIKEKTVQQWIPIERFESDGIVKLKNGNIIKILKIEPINYNLKSDLEKKSAHIKQIEKNIQKKENKNIKELGKKYINYIKKINSSKRNSSKIFYLIISENLKKIENTNNAYEIIIADLKEKYFKVKECLARCGNSVVEINDREELIKVIDSFLNTRKFLNK